MAASFLILSVDDDWHIADILNRAARNTFEEARFISIQSFDEAARYLDGLQGPGPRLVLLDIDLQSELTGLDFLRLLRNHPQGRLVPVIALSANRSKAKVGEAYQQGVNAFSMKPFSYEDWKSYIQSLRHYWYETVTTPKLWFESEGDE